MGKAGSPTEEEEQKKRKKRLGGAHSRHAATRSPNAYHVAEHRGARARQPASQPASRFTDCTNYRSTPRTNQALLIQKQQLTSRPGGPWLRETTLRLVLMQPGTPLFPWRAETNDNINFHYEKSSCGWPEEAKGVRRSSRLTRGNIGKQGTNEAADKVPPPPPPPLLPPPAPAERVGLMSSEKHNTCTAHTHPTASHAQITTLLLLPTSSANPLSITSSSVLASPCRASTCTPSTQKDDGKGWTMSTTHRRAPCLHYVRTYNTSTLPPA